MSSLFNRPRGVLGAAATVLTGAVRPRVFVSYHHARDQWFYNEFTRLFHGVYETIEDRSLERRYDSDNLEYVRWAVANGDIKGTSCTVVLCGAETYQRKFVDWEIKATLDDGHGLVGVCLPDAPREEGGVRVPTRLSDNYHSGYAIWGMWTDLSVDNLRAWIASARHNASIRRDLIVNPREIKRRNG